jgi:deazaflavin-dependent oxidoreductase (nitroreductase family)
VRRVIKALEPRDEVEASGLIDGLIAAKGGAPQDPGWYRNLLANPEVEVQVGTAKMTARTRTATGEERARLWEKALEFWPPYADYQMKTEREIPVVVPDPVG